MSMAAVSVDCATCTVVGALDQAARPQPTGHIFAEERAGEDRWRDRDAEGLSGFEIDYQVKRVGPSTSRSFGFSPFKILSVARS